ncbi:MAG TPA: S26 family signal peptidase [Euzebyales bacterium]|nr:S26 family signal peptidase [Euzebyales bacterium]
MLRPLTITLGAAAVLWARRGGLRHVIVTGSSMHPTLCAGDRLLLVAAPGRPRPGQLALAHDPRSHDRELLKRVHAVASDGIDLRGDNTAASADSRVFGPVPARMVRTYVVWRYAPANRAGRVPGRGLSWSRAPADPPRSH